MVLMCCSYLGAQWRSIYELDECRRSSVQSFLDQTVLEQSRARQVIDIQDMRGRPPACEAEVEQCDFGEAPRSKTPYVVGSSDISRLSVASGSSWKKRRPSSR